MDSQDSPPKAGASNGGPKDGDRRTAVLVVRVCGHTCALRIEDVIETMRPLPVQPLTGVPEMVRGLSMVRGEPVVVVALGEVFGDSGSQFERFILTRTGERQVALAVDSVVGGPQTARIQSGFHAAALAREQPRRGRCHCKP